MTPLETLRKAYPWPARRPDVAPSHRGWDGGGRDIVASLIRRTSAKIVLEIGAFLGLSTRQWLACAPDVTVICIDPWNTPKPEEWVALKDWPEICHKEIYDLFLSSNWDFQDRIIPIRGLSPAAVRDVHACGVQPDIVYIDGEHTYNAVLTDLTECYRLFPNAFLTGDDWNWSKDLYPPRSVREAVIDFSEARDWSVQYKKNTWVLPDSGRQVQGGSVTPRRWSFPSFLFGRGAAA